MYISGPPITDQEKKDAMNNPKLTITYSSSSQVHYLKFAICNEAKLLQRRQIGLFRVP